MLSTNLAMIVPFLLVMCRVAGAVSLLPGLGEADAPVLVRASLVTALSILLTPVVAPLFTPHMPDIADLARLIATEVLVGMLIGWLARVAALALPIAGQVISLMTGLSSVLQPDPALGAQSAVIGRLFGLFVPVLLLTTGLYAMPLAALAHSYTVLPPGQPLNGADALQAALVATGSAMTVALGLAAPFILVGLVWQVALGLLARLVPQLQIYFAALPGQVLGGLALVALLAGACADSAIEAMRAAFAALPAG